MEKMSCSVAPLSFFTRTHIHIQYDSPSYVSKGVFDFYWWEYTMSKNYPINDASSLSLPCLGFRKVENAPVACWAMFGRCLTGEKRER